MVLGFFSERSMVDGVSFWTIRARGRLIRVRKAFPGTALLRFLSKRVCSVACHDPACRTRHDRFILEPKKPKVVDALRKIRLDDNVSRNHCAWKCRRCRRRIAVAMYVFIFFETVPTPATYDVLDTGCVPRM